MCPQKSTFYKTMILSSVALTLTTPRLILQSINERCLASIKSIFQNKCFDCHSESISFQWYYNIPAIKQMMDNDIKEMEL